MVTRYFIDTPTRRKKLSPRREPYWHKIMTGRYLGYRQTERGGHWVARINVDGSQRYHTESFTDNLTFDQAVEVAGSGMTVFAYIPDVQLNNLNVALSFPVF